MNKWRLYRDFGHSAAMCAALLLGSFCTAEGRFADISIQQERQLAQHTVAQLQSNPNVKHIRPNGDLLRIQQEIVLGNPGVLWFEDGVHETFLRPVQEIKYADRSIEAFNCQDGYIFMSTDFLRFANHFVTRTYIERENTPEHIYNNSHIAWTLGHEIAHWKNDQLLKRTDKQEVAFENRADLSALDYLDGTALYSYGGGLIANARNEEVREKSFDETWKDAHHAPNSVRYKRIAKYIQEASGGRIRIKENGSCTFDGKPFAPDVNYGGYAPKYQAGLEPADAMKAERTMYVAGQIAFAIKHGVWGKAHLRYCTQDELFGNGSDRIVLMVDNPKTGGIKVIDKFTIGRDRFKELLPLVGKPLPKANLSDEEIYCLDLLQYLEQEP